jgi:hypothetical protein
MPKVKTIHGLDVDWIVPDQLMIVWDVMTWMAINRSVA